MRSLAYILLVLSAGCATLPRHHPAETPLRTRVVETARGFLGRSDLSLSGKALPTDCLSLPRAAYGANGLDLGAPTTAALYRKVRDDGRLFSRGVPRRGDLVFLRDSDRTQALHVGLVSGVEADGTVIVLQRMARGVTAYRMNPRHPHDQRASRSTDEARAWNDTIASHGDGAPAGALFSGYASLLP